jgi:hypothetical protein
MNLLYVAIDPTLYGHYFGGKAYPNADYPFPPEIADVTNYSGCTDTNDCANVKVTHGMALMQCNDVINTNSTLINAFLDLVLVAFKQSFKQIRMENPNSIFCKMFAWFVTKYSCTSADDCKANCTAMALEWHPSLGFELLVTCLFWGATFANLAKHPIPDNDVISIGICVIHQTGLFAEEYKAWIMHSNNPTHNMDFATFHTFWETAINIASFTATPALQHGYGMNAVEDDARTASLTDAVSNFGTAYATMQERIHSNNDSSNAIRGRSKRSAMQLATSPLPACFNTHSKTTKIFKHKAASMANNKTQGQQGQPSGGGGGTNNGGGRNGLYRGNNNGSGYNQGSGMTFNGGGGNYPTQGTSETPPSPLKHFNNWNYSHTHGGNIHNNHTSATFAQPGVNHQRAATRFNTMGGNIKGLYKTVLPSATGQCPPAAHPPLPSTNYTPIFLMPFGNNGP